MVGTSRVFRSQIDNFWEWGTFENYPAQTYELHPDREVTGIWFLDDFYEEFHTFRLDWNPGKIEWYVDDVKVYEETRWYSGADESSRLTYPAPFDHDLYVILNLAVGGSWVCTKADISAHNFDKITELCRQARTAIDEVRGK